MVSKALKQAGGEAQDAAAAFDGLDEDELDDGAWGQDQDLDIADEDAEIAEAGNEFEPEDGVEADEEGWEMEVSSFCSLQDDRSLPLNFRRPIYVMVMLPNHLLPFNHEQKINSQL